MINDLRFGRLIQRGSDPDIFLSSIISWTSAGRLSAGILPDRLLLEITICDTHPDLFTVTPCQDSMGAERSHFVNHSGPFIELNMLAISEESLNLEQRATTGGGVDFFLGFFLT
jgi:hypothetical protein